MTNRLIGFVLDTVCGAVVALAAGLFAVVVMSIAVAGLISK